METERNETEGECACYKKTKRHKAEVKVRIGLRYMALISCKNNHGPYKDSKTEVWTLCMCVCVYFRNFMSQFYIYFIFYSSKTH